MSKLTVAILFGGASEEHDVSIKSARTVAENIDTNKYEPIYIGITRDGRWLLADKPNNEFDHENAVPVILAPDESIHGLIALHKEQHQIIRIDAVFAMLHGKTGEDGSIQGLFELARIPYVGCDIESSVLCRDKTLTYMMSNRAGLKTPTHWALEEGEQVDSSKFTYPVFVKPARSGSSFGVNKVHNESELQAAIDDARIYDNKVLIEEAVPGVEIGVSVLGNGAELTTGEIDQINLTHGFFKIHQEKNPNRNSNDATIVVPAPISRELSDSIKETAKKIYRSFGCAGLARIDMYLQEDGSLVMNEINTMPGFTSYSRYPAMMAAAGMEMTELLDKLITLALER
ncbi:MULTISPECIES: D-alanine--D-alanine ligase family protein [Amylolactobacillus]|nr:MULTISPECIES: D-alanine--D-alanine ligase family protein [Amylolactobacillus]APT17905.1 D-alanine--(R)-lactate ligase VanF [Amylolactobacillus amylophilus DSM 20533 = JCM 1125]GED79841.1 vancomycin B-type resistance protein VanB [Amylolactobacillus amylophilus]